MTIIINHSTLTVRREAHEGPVRDRSGHSAESAFWRRLCRQLNKAGQQRWKRICAPGVPFYLITRIKQQTIVDGLAALRDPSVEFNAGQPVTLALKDWAGDK